MTITSDGLAERAPVKPFVVPLPTGFELQGELSALEALPDPAALADRDGLLMISIRNRGFTKSLIDAYCRFAAAHLRSGYLTVVDQPYIQNILALADDGTRTSRIDGLRRLAADRTRQVERVLRRYGSERLVLISWAALADRTPAWLTSEVRTAWDDRGLLYADLMDQARQRVGWDADVATLERWALFLVEETPVLLYAYYALTGGVVDVYPGPLPDYLWRIERGDYAAELPRVSALVRNHEGLVYANVQMTPS